jgi:CopG family nickel-responsive transcriptional regulator
MEKMAERFTISLESDLAEQFDAYIEAKGYTNRSEAVRDLIRERLASESLDARQTGQCIAALTYVFNHHELDLAARLMDIQHEHHDLTLASQHVHLDHENCVETVFLRGSVQSVRKFAESVIAERGVRHGNLHIIPTETGSRHHHGAGSHHHHTPMT